MKIKVILLLFLVLLITGCKNNESINSFASKKEIDISIISTTTKTSKKTTTKKLNIIKTTSKRKRNNKKSIPKSTSINSSTSITKIDKSPKIDNYEEDNAYQTMMNLQAKYPTGTMWDNKVPYSCEENPYKLRGLVDGKIMNGCGCAAFVFMLSNSYFKDAPGKKVYSLEEIRVGDIIRYMHDSHSIIILKIIGDTYIVAEANISTKEDKQGRVIWNQRITKKEILNNGFNYLITRW